MPFTYFKYIDPGLVQTRKATKSVVAALVTLLLVAAWTPKIGILFACLAALFITLCSEGGTLPERINSILIAGAGFVIALTAGWLLEPFHWVAGIVLVLLTFLAFYARRFGVRYFLFPPVAVVIYLLATYFPIGNAMDGLYESLATAVGSIVALGVFLTLWPNQSPLLSVRHQMLRIFNKCDVFLVDIANHVEHQATADVYRQQRRLLVQTGADLSDVFSAMEKIRPTRYQPEWLEVFWVKQFAFYKALTMVWESLLQLAKPENNVQLHTAAVAQQLRAIRQELQAISQTYSRLGRQSQVTPPPSQEAKVYGQYCRNAQQYIHLLNLTFALNRCSELLKVSSDMLNEETRWLKGKRL